MEASLPLTLEATTARSDIGGAGAWASGLVAGGAPCPGRARAAAHDLDQLARKRDRLACLQDVVVEREAPKSSVHVLADDLRRLGDSRRHRHGASFRSETVKQLLGVLFVFRQHEGETDREQDIGRISIHRFAVLFENLLLSLQVLEVASEPVADIAVLREKPEGL